MADGQALLALLDAKTDLRRLRDAVDTVQQRLGPVLQLGASSPAETVRAIARHHGSLVTSMVKSINGWLSSDASREHLLLFAEAACLALDALDCLRPVMKASRYELEVQRYNIVRKMAAIGLHEHALAQGKILHASTASGPGTVSGPGDLQIAAVANLLVCYSALAKAEGADVDNLWNDVHAPVCGLLSLAREAPDPVEAGKRLEPVLKCLTKVAETLYLAHVMAGTSSPAAAEQICALVACSEVCRQVKVVEQMLLEETAAAAPSVQSSLVAALLHHLDAEGGLPDPLWTLLHQTAVNLAQNHTEPTPSLQDRETTSALASVVRTAVLLPSCVLAPQPSQQVPALCAQLADAVKDLCAQPDTDDNGSRLSAQWYCLDVLRSSVQSVLTPLANAPQMAGGKLFAVAQCMERLCLHSLRTGHGDSRRCSAALQSGFSAAAIAARLQAAHCMCTGQYASLHEDVSRILGLLQELLKALQELAESDSGSDVATSAVLLQSLSASFGNIGLDLLQAQHVAPAVELLRVSAELAIKRAAQLQADRTAAAASADVAPLVKKCKAHVAAMQQLSNHQGVMDTAAAYVAQLHKFLDDSVQPVSPLVKLFVRSSVLAFETSCAPAQPAEASAASDTAASAGPAAPCKAPRRGGRVRRVQTEQSGAEPVAASAKPVTGTSARAGGISKPVSSSAGVPRTLMQCLSDVVEPNSCSAGLLDSLDMYAIQELKVLAEDGRKLPGAAVVQQAYQTAVLGVLTKCAEANTDRPALRARATLVRALTTSADLVSQLSNLRDSLRLLDPDWKRSEGPGSLADLCRCGLADSAALAHARMGACLAQEELSKPGCSEPAAAIEHAVRALALWSELLESQEPGSPGPQLRMPQATLHAALLLQQLLGLHADAHSGALENCSRVLCRLVGVLGRQVKLHEQDVYLLCSARPWASCVTWAVAAPPCPAMAEAIEGSNQNKKLAAVLALINPIREAASSRVTDHNSVAMAAAACSAELERSGFLRHGPAPLLLRSQCHQVAAAAYLRGGDTSNAYVHTQEALRITCAVFGSLDCCTASCQDQSAASSPRSSDSATEQGDLTPAEAAAAAVKSGAEASASYYAIEEEEEASDGLGVGAQDQVPGATCSANCSTLPESKSRDNVCCGYAFAAAAAHLASLHQAARVFEAAGCVEDATSLWKECGRTADLFKVVGMKVLSNSYLAELSCRRGDAAAAQTHVSAATGAAEDAAGRTVTDMSPFVAQHHRAASLRLALLREEALEEVQEACSREVDGCREVLAKLGSRRNGQPGEICRNSAQPCEQASDGLVWQTVCVRAQLQRLRAEALLRLGRREDAVHTLAEAERQLQDTAETIYGQNASAVWPTDHGLLLAQRAAAALGSAVLAGPRHSAEVVGLGSLHCVSLGAYVDVGEGSTCSAVEENDGRPRTDQTSRRGAKAKDDGGRHKGLSKEPEADSVAPDFLSNSLLSSLPALLTSLRLCWQVPLAAAYACHDLMRACITLGQPHAASMFLHLGQGMSYAQHAELQRKLRQASARPQPPASTVEGVEQGNSPDCKEPSSVKVGTEGGSPVAEEIAVSHNIRDSALQLLSRLASTNRSGPDGDTLVRCLEEGASAWLQEAVSRLPDGAVVSSITQDAQGCQLLLGRIARGAAPVLVSLKRSYEPDAASRDRSANEAANSCLAKLLSLQEESSDSMRVDQDTHSSQGQKAKWWKKRTALDQGMQGVLQDLESGCLGPWRCLLLPVPISRHGTLRAAAAAFAAEHFPTQQPKTSGGEPLSGAASEPVLHEVLTVALAQVPQLKVPEVRQLLHAVCSQGGFPCDAAHVSALAQHLIAAEAAARVELLWVRASDEASSSETTTGPSRTAKPVVSAIPGPEATGSSSSGPTETKEASSSTCRNLGRACVAAHSSRTRLGAATRAQPAAASAALKPATLASGRRTISTVAASNDENAKPGASGAVASRSTRATRLTAVQPEAPSSRAAAAAPRGVSAAAAVAQPIQDTCPDRVVTTAAAARPDAGPVLLLLSPALHALPWESMLCCQDREFYRILSLPLACAANAAPQQASATASVGSMSRDSSSNGGSSAGRAETQTSAYYVLNPSGDLLDTQRFFQPLLEVQPGWQGLVGVRPDAKVLTAALQAHDLFFYFGHGSGEQFLPLPALRKLKRCATSILMGCSSGRLRLHGAYDPAGAAPAYLLAGCPALVANLWDVTDRDIDRYCEALMQAWLGCVSPVEGGRGRDTSVGPGAGAGGGAGDQASGTEPLGLAATRGRSACKLKYMTGAAAVCYGVPLRWG